jgi:hypothetical protein
MHWIRAIIPEIRRRQVTETGLLLVLACLWMAWSGSATGQWLLITGVVAVLTLLVPWIFYPVAVLWFGLGRILGIVVPKLMLSLLFWVLVTPVALIKRASGRDELRLRQFRKGRESVFADRDHTFGPKDMQHPF